MANRLIGYVGRRFVVKTILIIVGCVAIVSAMSIQYFRSSYERRMLDAFATEVENTRQLIESSYADPLWNVQDELIRTLNEAVLSPPAYLAIVVYDVDGSGRRQIGQATRKITTRKRVGYSHTRRLPMLEEEDVEMARGALHHQGVRIGEYELYYTKGQVAEHMRNNLYNLVGSFLLISFVIVLSLVVLLNQFVIKKLFAIIEFAKRVATEQRYDRRLEMRSEDEIGALADSINEMLAQIERRDKEKDEVGRELLRSKSYLQSLFDAIPDGLFVHEPDLGKILDVNRAACDMFESVRERLVGQDVGWIGQGEGPGEEGVTFQHLERARREGPQTATWRAKRPSGEPFWAEAHVMHSIIGGEGRFILLVRNVTERKRAEEALRHVRQYLANVIDSMPSILVGVDEDGKVTQWNVQAQRATGLTAREAEGRPLELAFPRLAEEMARVRQAMATRETQMRARKARQEAGETRFEDVTVYPLVANGAKGAVIRVDDVTEHVRIEEMMLQSEKMLSVGGLAAGMAHEINNPLGGMVQTANVMGERLANATLPANRRAAEEAGTTMEAVEAFMRARGIFRMLENIRTSGSRAAEVVTNMLSFARKDDAVRHEHDLAELLDRCVDLAGSDYDLKKKYDFRQVEIAREYEEGVPPVPCLSGKIQQVLLNVLRNGAEAMQEEKAAGGGAGKKPKIVLRLAHEKAAKRVRIEIEDNGPGMDEATRRRIFEPFFTTKPADRGTGLGLSVSYFIVTENHGGEMWVESEKGRGAKFVIRLPLERGEG